MLDEFLATRERTRGYRRGMKRFLVAGALAASVLAADYAHAQEARKLSLADARSEIRRALKKEFTDAIYLGGPTVKGCERRSPTRVRCNRVSWPSGDLSFEGWATAQSRRSGAVRVTYEITSTNEYCADLGYTTCSKTYRRR